MSVKLTRPMKALSFNDGRAITNTFQVSGPHGGEWEVTLPRTVRERAMLWDWAAGASDELRHQAGDYYNSVFHNFELAKLYVDHMAPSDTLGQTKVDKDWYGVKSKMVEAPPPPSDEEAA
jgi:hypothetical protein